MRDEVIETSLNYREKLGTKSLDMVNANMIKMYNAEGDFKSALNSIRDRQNELIITNNLMVEWFTLKMSGDRTSERPQPSFPEYTPSNVGYPYE